MGRFTVGDGFAVYHGATSDSPLHRHAAFQIVVGVGGPVTMVDEDQSRFSGTALLVAPMVRHRLLAAENLRTVYVEPHSRMADGLRRRVAGISVAPDLADAVIEPMASHELDPRLALAVELLLERDVPMSALAAAAGLSVSRLRDLAYRQMGLPLSRWRVWARLRRAAEALADGQTPAVAAVSAGFADQAHLTRWMREMIGVTPAAVVPVLRAHGRLPT